MCEMQNGIPIKYEEHEISNQKLWIMLIGYLTIYGIRELIGFGVPDSLFSLFCLLAFVILDSEQSFCFYMATIITTIPFLEVRIVYIFMTLFRMVYQKRNIRFEKRQFVLIISMLLLQFIDVIIFDKNSFGTMLYNYVNVVTVFIIPLLWSTLNLSKKHIEAAAKCFMSGCIICAFSLIWQSIGLYGLSYVIGGSNRLGMDLNLGRSTMTTSLNTNALAELMVCVIIICFALYYERRMKLYTVSILSIFAMITILLTQSRGGLLCLTLFLIYFVLFCINGRMALFKKIGVVLAIIAIVVFILTKFPDLQSGILNRINNQSDISNGRLELNADCLNAWSKNIYTILFGYGARNYMSAASDLKNSAHNMFVDILASWGITGVTLIIGWIIVLLKKHIGNVERVNKKIALIPIAMYLISLQDGQFLNVEIPFLLVSFFLIFGSIFKKELEL